MDVFGPWKAEKHEDNSNGRNYLVVRRQISNQTTLRIQRNMRIHRSTTGAPIWYTEAGATKKAKELNEKA